MATATKTHKLNKPKGKSQTIGKTKQNVFELVTNLIGKEPHKGVNPAALEAGTVPWRKPWSSLGAPRSMSTGKAYRGVNPFLLMMSAEASGFSSPWWGTYDNVSANGGQIRKGQKSTLVVFWKTGVRPAKADEIGDKDGNYRWATLQYFRVFNAEQADWPDGLPTRFQPVAPAEDFDPIEEAEAIIGGYLSRPGSPRHSFGGDRACYSPGGDHISMPPFNTFESAEAFAGTFFHEMGHSTGHKDRLNRPDLNEFHKFGDEWYAREELVAEMTAAMLCGIAGIEQVRMAQSAAYIANWLGALKGDKKLVVQAAAQAQRAADLILGTTFDDEATEPAESATTEVPTPLSVCADLDLNSAPVVQCDERRRTGTWTVSEADGVSNLVTLIATHDGGLKEYFAIVRCQTERQSGPNENFTVREFMPYDSVTVARQKVGRFSDKAFAAFFDTALAALREQASNEADPKHEAVCGVIEAAKSATVAA